METIATVAVVALVVGIALGMSVGQKIEREFVGAALAKFSRIDAEAHAAVNRLLLEPLAHLKKYL